MPYVVVGLESGVPWPTTETRVGFRGDEFLLRPETDRLAPTVVLEYEAPMTYNDALALTRRLLSSLAWAKGGRLLEIATTGGGIPIQVGKGPDARLINPGFRIDYLPDPPDERASLALAFYREALNVNSTPYKFLGFFKIINTVFRDGNPQIAWINGAVAQLEDHLAKSRLAVLRGDGQNIGQYLYASGRCAVAHAFHEPFVDPDDPEDMLRLTLDLPLVKALAEYLIEHELGLQSQRTVWREHLYELEGFRTLLGLEIVAALRERRDVAINVVPVVPRLNIRIRDRDPFLAFENLNVELLEASGGRLLARCISGDQLFTAGLSLNFAEERLEFDPVQGVAVVDDGSAQAMRYALDRVGFVKAMYHNGALEVWDADRRVLLGRCDPFIPTNIPSFHQVDEYLDRTAIQIRGELARREGVRA